MLSQLFCRIFYKTMMMTRVSVPLRVSVYVPLSSRARVAAPARRRHLPVRAEVQETKKNGDGFLHGVIRAVRSLLGVYSVGGVPCMNS